MSKAIIAPYNPAINNKISVAEMAFFAVLLSFIYLSVSFLKVLASLPSDLSSDLSSDLLSDLLSDLFR